MQNIKISDATNNDRKQLMNWFNFYHNQELAENRVGCYLTHNSTVVAKDNNKIIGVLQWHVKENAAHGLAEIEEVLITEEYRGKGLGSLLVLFAIDAIRTYFIELKIRPRKIFLFVARENTAARKLYEKHGFRLINSIGYLFFDDAEELFYLLDL